MTSFVTHGGERHLSNLGQLSLLRGVAEKGASLRTTVRGSSMTPFIRDEDVVTISPMNGRLPRVGEVVAFVHPGGERLAIHRVIACTDRGWAIRGDNCPRPDGVVGLESILGRVVDVERDGRRVRVGFGLSGRLIAFLNRGPLLGGCTALMRLPRRAAGLALRHAQGLAVFRWLGRRVGPAFEIAVASHAECESFHHRGAPDPHVTTWVARTGSRTIGFAQLTTRPEEGSGWGGHWLFSLSVQARFRGLGVGAALTRAVVDRSVAAGAPDLRLALFEDDLRAIRLFEKLGFEKIVIAATEPGYLDEKAARGTRRIVMRKRLDRTT